MKYATNILEGRKEKGKSHLQLQSMPVVKRENIPPKKKVQAKGYQQHQNLVTEEP